jgi:transcription-repair coupling factor (superfamily II helicase)
VEKMAELMIPSVTPPNLERGDFWFSENLEAIKKARFSNPWWRDNVFFAEKDLCIKPSEFTRKILDLGYERGPTVRGKGVFAVRGGIIEIWPIHTKKPMVIEFSGNAIAEIYEQEERQEVSKLKIPAQSLEKLEPGSFVVHADHGIGIYRGTSFVKKNEKAQTPSYGVTFAPEQFHLVEYAPPAPGQEPDKLYVPTNQKDRLTPYVGFEIPRVHRLGGTIWFKTKKKAWEDAEKLARELLELYAKREIAERSPYEGDQTIEETVREEFAYEETEDQLSAEKEILEDLSGSRPMDRVLCGDVGFGKTELALRAALRVMTSGRQVALLCPTTILAAQHEKTFRERLRDTPLSVAMLSRLTPKNEEAKILKGLSHGSIDCVIGTHRLLSKDIVFSAQGAAPAVGQGSASLGRPGTGKADGKNLGLVIIDEEQRFGVKQKEKFKNLRAEIDLLSLSATPIPRTLSLALAKLRDISLLSTPPLERLPIHTLVYPYSQKLIRAAISFELERGGQIYFLHNRIETIGHVKEKLQKMKLKRPLKVEIIHGRMSESQILKAMNSFREKTCNLLLATTIIENGLDIASANTLIVDDATRLGLAQAHQLRGRIGRSAEQGFAYFFYRPHRLTEKAGDRLKALKEYAELGAGYQIALRDLEIRGAGNILGREQSGAINKVGLNLYCQMLSEALEERREVVKNSQVV